MSNFLEIGGSFPFLRWHSAMPQQQVVREVVREIIREVPSGPVQLPIPKVPKRHERRWVVMPDRRIGVVDHVKVDGTLGVRPVNADGTYCPNLTTHWNMEERWSIPEEHALTDDQVRDATDDEIPEAVK